MKDQIDILAEERDQRLLREIRKELRRGRLMATIAFAFFVVVVLLHAFGQLDNVDNLPVIVGIGVALIAAARLPQRDRLLRKAAEKLATRD